MSTISLCMIVKDEEDVLERCLESIHDIVDEIIIVDTGSTDNTINIAKKYTSKIYDFKWIDDFAAARNYSFSKASMDYIMWLDADDLILQKDKNILKELKGLLNPNVDIVMIRYNTGFDEYNNVTLSFFRERIVKRSNNYIWLEPIHEYIDLHGNIFNCSAAVTHKKSIAKISNRNITILENFIAKGNKLSQRGIYSYARELHYNNRYKEAIIYFNKFLRSNEGLVEDNINSCHILSKCYKEIDNNEKRLKSLLRSFEYAIPRGEICCELGQYYLEHETYESNKTAIFWYETAANLKKPDNTFGFIEHDCYGYTPHIQLALCYYKLGNIEKSIEHNNKAAEYKPNSPSVLHNKKYFESLQSESVSKQ